MKLHITLENFMVAFISSADDVEMKKMQVCATIYRNEKLHQRTFNFVAISFSYLL